MRNPNSAKCSVETCNNPLLVAGLCNMHYKRKQRYGDALADTPAMRQSIKEKPCAICGRVFKPQLNSIVTCSQKCGYKLLGAKRTLKALEIPPPQHPAIIGPAFVKQGANGKTTMIKLRCPRCDQTRECTLHQARVESRRPNFKGLCRRCSFISRRDGTHRTRGWGKSKRLHQMGYMILSANDVPDDLLPMFRKMQNKAYQVLEHRWEMAKHLKRPLERNELVDHLNGNKLDNHVENLRIYIQGKDQPGACGGYGTYYHEWQMALARIAELEAEILIRHAP